MLHGTDTFRDSFQKMLISWTVSVPDAIAIMKKNIKLDPHFASFAEWASKSGVPIVVLSSGMVTVIRALLNELLGEQLARDIEVVANEIQPRAPVNNIEQAGGWTIKFHDDSDFGHDKSLTIRPYAQAIAKMKSADSESGRSQRRPTLLYAGDGVSDVSAAKETDLLFAKKGRDLITYCERENIPFTIFEDWGEILDKTREIFDGEIGVLEVAEEGRDQISIESRD